MSKAVSEDVLALIQIFDKSEWQELRMSSEGYDIILSKRVRAERAATLSETTALHHLNPIAAATLSSETPRSLRTSEPSARLDAEPQAIASAPKTSINLVEVRAPNLGTFYRAPKPGAPNYVEIGQSVEPDTDVCLIEVMKLFTPVKARIKGHIRTICAEDGELIEYDQALFYIEPIV